MLLSRLPQVIRDQPTYQNLFHSVIRTIVVHNPVTGQQTTTAQTVVFGRVGIYDQVAKGFTSFGQWQLYENGALTDAVTGTWAEFTAPTFAGYTPSLAKVAAAVVTAETTDQTVEITYANNGQHDHQQPSDHNDSGRQAGDKSDQEINQPGDQNVVGNQNGCANQPNGAEQRGMAKTKAGDATIVNGPATSKNHTLPQTENAEKERFLVAVGLVGLTELLVMLGLGKKAKRD